MIQPFQFFPGSCIINIAYKLISNYNSFLDKNREVSERDFKKNKEQIQDMDPCRSSFDGNVYHPDGVRSLSETYILRPGSFLAAVK